MSEIGGAGPVAADSVMPSRRMTQLRGGWTVDRVSLAFLAALLPSAIVAGVAEGGGALLTVGAVALATTLAWQLLFAATRGGMIGWDGIVTAVTMSLMLPLTATTWEILLAASAGVVLGEQIFGGRGRSFLSPAAVGLAFFSFSFPASMISAPASLELWPVALGAAFLVLLGLVSWRVLVAAYVGLGLVAWLGGGLDADTVMSAQFGFALLFLGADPVSAAATNLGRWAYGFLIGALSVLFAGSFAVVFAVLLASIFAPLLDQGAVAAMGRWRRRS